MASWSASAASSGLRIVRTATAHSRERCRCTSTPNASPSPSTWAASSSWSLRRRARPPRRGRAGSLHRHVRELDPEAAGHVRQVGPPQDHVLGGDGLVELDGDGAGARRRRADDLGVLQALARVRCAPPARRRCR